MCQSLMEGRVLPQRIALHPAIRDTRFAHPYDLRQAIAKADTQPIFIAVAVPSPL